MGRAHFQNVDVLFIMELMSNQGIPALFRRVDGPPRPRSRAKKFACIKPHVAASVISGTQERMQSQKFQLRCALRGARGACFGAAFGNNAAALIIQAVPSGCAVLGTDEAWEIDFSGMQSHSINDLLRRGALLKKATRQH